MHAATVELSTRERIEGRVARLLSGLPGSWLLKVIGERPEVVDGQTLDAHLQFILAARRLKRQRLLCEPTPEAGRSRFRREVQAVTTGSASRPTRVKSVRTLTVPGADGPLDARLYTPLTATGDAPQPLLVFLHGGGFVIGDLDTHDEPCRLLCHHGGMQVLSVAYRLAPEHPFPAGLEDVIAATRWAQHNAHALGAAASQVCVGGDSAGATLATVAALTLAREGAVPFAQLLIYPATDVQSATPSRTALFPHGYVLSSRDMDAFRGHYLAHDVSRFTDPRASPLLTPDLTQAAPAVIVTAGFDPLRDEGEAYADALQDAGVPVRRKRFTGMVHGFLHMTTVAPGARAAMVETARMFRTHVDAQGRGR
jgi:acetyl esterase